MSARLKPLVLLPGLLNDAALWRAQIQALAPDAAAIVPDLTLDATIDAMARRVLAAAPPTFALAALSMGGYVAFEIMRQAPGLVTRLALLSTSAAPDSEQKAADRRRAIASLRRGRFLGVTEGLLPKLIHPDQVAGPVGREVKAMAQRVGAAAFLRQQQAIMGRQDSRPTLERIHVPTLIVVGEDDVLTPRPHAEEMHRGIAGSELHVLPACGHLTPMERPEAVTALMRAWLAAD